MARFFISPLASRGGTQCWGVGIVGPCGAMDTGLRRYDGVKKNAPRPLCGHPDFPEGEPGPRRKNKCATGVPNSITKSLYHLHTFIALCSEPLHHCEFNGGFLEFALPQVGIALGITDRQGRNKSPHVQFII